MAAERGLGGAAPAFLRGAARRIACRWAEIAFVVLATLLAVWVIWEAFGLRLITFQLNTDYWEHSAALRALLVDFFHPGNPHLASPTSSPRYGPLFLIAAAIGHVFALDPLQAMSVVAALNTLLLLSGIYFFFRVYFRDARAPLYGLFVLFGSWYYGWHFSNVYQLQVYFSVSAYPSSGALGLTLWSFGQAVRVLRGETRERLGLGVLSLLWALLFITHPLTAAAGFAGGGALALTEPGVPLKRRAWVVATIFIGSGASAVWPYFSPWTVLTGGVRQEADWAAEASASEPVGGRHRFYRTGELSKALGLALAGIPISVYFLVVRKHLFVALGALSMMGAFYLNAYVPLPIGHRFVLLAILFLQIAVVWLLLALTRGSSQAFRWVSNVWVGAAALVLVWGVLGYAAYHNVTLALRKFGPEALTRGRVSSYVRHLGAVGDRVGPDGVVLANALNSWAVPTFGPKVVALHHLNPLVPDQFERNERVWYFFRNATDAERLETIRRYGVTHVLVTSSEERSLDRFLQSIGKRRRIGGEFVLYTLDGRGRR